MHILVTAECLRRYACFKTHVHPNLMCKQIDFVFFIATCSACPLCDRVNCSLYYPGSLNRLSAS